MMRISGRRNKVVLNFSPIEKHRRVYSSVHRFVDYGKLHMMDEELMIGKSLGFRKSYRIR